MPSFDRIMLSLALALACTLPAVAEGASPALPAPFQLSQSNRVTDSANGFSIIPPKGWTKDDPGNDLLVFVDVQDDLRGGHMSLSASQDNTPLETLGPLLKAEFDKQGIDWELQQDGMVKISGQKTYYINGLVTVNNKELQVLQFYIQGKPGQIYILTYTVLADEFENYEQELKASADSFKLL